MDKYVQTLFIMWLDDLQFILKAKQKWNVLFLEKEKSSCAKLQQSTTCTTGDLRIVRIYTVMLDNYD